MKFQNKLKDHNLSKEENARLDNLRRSMLIMGITIIKIKDLFFSGSICIKEPNLAMFRYNEQDENLLKKMQAPENVS